MSIRIAVATTDGKVVNEHFGRAKAFTIIDLEEKQYQVIEKREAAPVCSGGEHSDGAMAEAIALLLDCQAVLVSRIGQMAKRALEINKLSVFEIGIPVEDALAKLQNYYYKKVW